MNEAKRPHNDQSCDVSEDPIVSRRTVLKSTVAIGLSATLLGCQEQETAAKEEGSTAIGNSPAREEPRSVSTHRVYIVEQGDRFFEFFAKLEPRPQNLRWTNVRGLALPPKDSSTDGKKLSAQPTSNFLVWATKEEAKKLGESEGIKSLKLMESIVEVGEPKQAQGKLAVRVFPHANPFQQKTDEKLNYQKTEDVLAEWQKKLASVRGIKLSMPNSNPEGQSFGEVPEAGQVLIEFKGELDPRVLSVIKSHPQTVAFRWGDLFKYYFCPGCGLG